MRPVNLCVVPDKCSSHAGVVHLGDRSGCPLFCKLTEQGWIWSLLIRQYHCHPCHRMMTGMRGGGPATLPGYMTQAAGRWGGAIHSIPHGSNCWDAARKFPGHTLRIRGEEKGNKKSRPLIEIGSDFLSISFS